MGKTLLDRLAEKYPFLTVCTYAGDEYVGIIQNADSKVLSIYVYELLPYDLKQSFLEYGANWWWESNRKIPINIFIGKEFKKFRPYLRTYSLKETKILFGPVTQLSALTDLKRVRRKTVQLLRTVK